MPTDPASIASSSSTSLPTRFSPKRKRENVTLSSSPLKASPLRVTTNASSLTQTPVASRVDDLTQSPRSHVATRFSDMEITPVSLNNNSTTISATMAPLRKLEFKTDHSPLSQAIGGRAKKQRRSLAIAKEIPETPSAREGISEGVRKLADIERADVGLEMDEQNSTVPGGENSPTAKRKNQPTEMKALVNSSPGIEPSLGRSPPAANGMKCQKGPPVRTKSPPIPDGKSVWIDSPPNRPHLSKAPELVELVDMMESVDNGDGSSDTETGSLHWEDSEITGHDPSDPEDDGEGINGIGFKPTAAIARDRSERRRRQLEQYKKREDAEARAARAKRSEARRRAILGEEDKANEDAEARRVRFADKERAMDVL